MGKPLIVYNNAPAFKEWLTNFKFIFNALGKHDKQEHFS